MDAGLNGIIFDKPGFQGHLQVEYLKKTVPFMDKVTKEH